MDCRMTMDRAGFADALTNAHIQGDKLNLLVDDGGLSRMEGIITNITLDKNDRIVELNNGKRIMLSQIVAVNGIFSSDYSEC